MNRPLCALVLLLAAQPAFGQAQQPFDMSPEAGVDQPLPQSPPQPAPSAAETPSPVAPAVPSPVATTRRNLVPFPKLVLSGEVDSRAWTFWLTNEQALAPATFHLAYQSAIVVAPESSTLEVLVNGVSVLKTPVKSPDRVSELQAELPPSLLKPGANSFAIQISQRHRTDCTIESTYDLWTEIKPAGTYLGLESGALVLNRLEDLPAVGVDEDGNTKFNLVVPGLDRTAIPISVTRLAQTVAMAANMPNQSFVVSQQAMPETGPGRLPVLVGTASELGEAFPDLPPTAASAPFAGFVQGRTGTGSMLVVSGPNWQAIDTAIAGIAAPLDRPPNVLRTSLSTGPWRTPDAPIFREKGSKTFAELGVPTQEFSGRRFRADFAFGIPADFYANSYGEATILLDAAYAAGVLPGSHIDIYVNSDIAATVPITQAGGAILRHFPVSVTMRHFRPGANVIAVEAVLLTEQDRVCAPGATASNERRFVLFDTSELHMPNFARIARRPDLAGLAGTGFPYNGAEGPVSLFVADRSPETLSSASTLLARLAVAAGRQIPLTASSMASAVAENAIFVGPVAEIDPQVLQQAGISDQVAVSWAAESSRQDGAAQTPKTDETFARWREQLSGSGWRGSVSAFQDWLTRTFDLTVGSLRLLPGEAPPYLPGRDIRLVAAQQESPAGGSTWTVLTAPTPAMLDSATQVLTREANWPNLSGQIAALETDGEVQVPRTGNPKFVPTQEFSASNFRLVAANWLSGNPLSYAAGLFIACILLGLATSGLLSGLGRSK